VCVIFGIFLNGLHFFLSISVDKMFTVPLALNIGNSDQFEIICVLFVFFLGYKH
jgi:hypothetical protein